MSANSESIFVWSRGAIKTIQIPIRLFCWVSILHPVNGKATWILLCIFFSRYCAQFCFAIKEIQPSEPRASESLNFLIVRSCFFFCFVLFFLITKFTESALLSTSAVQCRAGFWEILQRTALEKNWKFFILTSTLCSMFLYFAIEKQRQLETWLRFYFSAAYR